MNFGIVASLFCLTAFLSGCMDANSTATNVRVTGLSGGFRENESLIAYEALGSMRRSGEISETGDTYSYSSISRDIEIVPVKVPFSTDREISLAPKRVSVLAGCQRDLMTDAINCHMNIMPQAISGPLAGGLYQAVGRNGSILKSCVLGHDFPGRRAAIRVDNNTAIATDHEGCVSGAAARTLEAQLKQGATLTTRRVEWPYDYSQDRVMLIDGSFSAAQELYKWTASTDLTVLFP